MKKYDDLSKKGFEFIGKGYKPLCITKRGLLTYRKHGLYEYDGTVFHHLADIPCGMKERITDSFRLLERATRSEPQSAVCADGHAYIARRHSVDRLNIETHILTRDGRFRKPYIHTRQLTYIHGVEGFDSCIAYGEYFGNAKREEVCIYARSVMGESADWKEVYRFPAGVIRHIHTLVPDSEHKCVYILTGDDNGESGIWKAVDMFQRVEPLLVGDQMYRACVAYTTRDGMIYATDIPSRENAIMRYDFERQELTELQKLPGTCTSGGVILDRGLFCTSIESEEPKSRGKLTMLRYLLSRKYARGIADEYPRIYMEGADGRYFELLRCEKDFLPGGLFRFGRVLPLVDEKRQILYIAPVAVKRYDGKLYRIALSDIHA